MGLGDMSKKGAGGGLTIPARDALIVAAYGRGEPLTEIAERFGLSEARVCVIAGRKRQRRNAPFSEHKRNSVHVYLSGNQYRRAMLAAKQRNLSIGRLVSRMAQTAVDDFALLDNLLDDGVKTEGPDAAA